MHARRRHHYVFRWALVLASFATGACQEEPNKRAPLMQPESRQGLNAAAQGGTKDQGESPLLGSDQERKIKEGEGDNDAVTKPEMVHGAYLASCVWVKSGSKAVCRIAPQDKDQALAINVEALKVKVTNTLGEAIRIPYQQEVVDLSKDREIGISLIFAEPVVDAVVRVVEDGSVLAVLCESAIVEARSLGGEVYESMVDALDWAEDLDWPDFELPSFDF